MKLNGHPKLMLKSIDFMYQWVMLITDEYVLFKSNLKPSKQKTEIESARAIRQSC